MFWATWCPYCNAAVPNINGLSKKFSDRLQILAINFKEDPKKVEPFMKAKKVSYPILYDTQGAIARKYGVTGIPTYVLVDKKGKIVYYDNGLPRNIAKLLD